MAAFGNYIVEVKFITCTAKHNVEKNDMKFYIIVYFKSLSTFSQVVSYCLF